MAGKHGDKYGTNQGEGNRAAANRYDDAATHHAQENDVKREAEEARRAAESGKAKELKQAETIGKRHAKEEDPEIRRNYKQPN